MLNTEIEFLKNTLERERLARKSAENILEEKSKQLFQLSSQLKNQNIQLQQLLKEKSTQLKGVFENINDAYVYMDLNGNILKFNDVAEKFFGYNVNKEKLNVSKLIYKSDLTYANKSFEKLKEKGSFSNYTARIVSKTNEVRWVQINATIVYDNNIPIAAQGIVRDITELKELELQKENILKDLEKSNNELQEYAHIVSHDLKSPLRSLEALTSWIKADNQNKFDEITTENFKLIDSTLENMDNLISNILKYSSVHSNENKQEEVDLNLLIKELKKGILIPNHISIKVINALPKVKGDKTKFYQLFQNLISNAVKFIDKKIGLIEIDFTEKKTHYQFSVKDNGIGIEEKYHKKIFKIFQSLNEAKDSSGIGLSIVNKIVNLYKGDIWLESKLNIGTTFIFTLKK